MKQKRVLLITNFILILVLLGIGLRENYPQRIVKKMNGLFKSSPTFKDTREYKHELGLYPYYHKKGNIVMLGNSITYRANWNELLNRTDIINRGIGNDITAGFLERMDYVVQVEPKICFVMGGLNDISDGIPISETATNMEQIIDVLVEHNIQPFICSTLHVTQSHKNQKELNSKIAELNGLLKKKCQQKNIRYINLNAHLSQDNHLIPKYSFDGAHLSGLGYHRWAEVISPIIKENIRNVETSPILKN